MVSMLFCTCICNARILVISIFVVVVCPHFYALDIHAESQLCRLSKMTDGLCSTMDEIHTELLVYDVRVEVTQFLIVRHNRNLCRKKEIIHYAWVEMISGFSLHQSVSIVIIVKSSPSLIRFFFFFVVVCLLLFILIANKRVHIYSKMSSLINGNVTYRSP